MKRFACVVIASTLMLLLLSGCSGDDSSKAVDQSGVNNTASNSASEQLSEQDKADIGSYITSDEFVGLFDTLTNTLDSLLETVENSDTAKLDEMSFDISVATSNLDQLEVPKSCEEIDYNIKQYSRSLCVAIAYFSDYLNGDGGEEKAIEASEYMDMAAGFANDLDAELQRILKLYEESE